MFNQGVTFILTSITHLNVTRDFLYEKTHRERRHHALLTPGR